MNKYLYIFILSMLATAEAEAAARAAEANDKAAPKLVVNITIDQLRADYLEAFMPLYGDGGFKKLLDEGFVCQQATVPFSPVDRASATASIATGTTPYYNGIPSSEWLSQKTLRPVLCTMADGKGVPGAAQLAVTTVGDELKIASQGGAKVYSVATQQDAAIMAAGHAADGAFWVDPKTGMWTTSAYYMRQVPLWVDAFNRLSAPAKKTGVKWTAVNDLTANFAYFQSSAVKKPFEHTFSGTHQYLDYTTSGLINQDVTELALQCVSSSAMGVDDVTDMLSLQYYAGTFRHQGVSGVQMELQDTYVRLDKAIASLIETLQRRVGNENILFVLTSTGYADSDDSDYSAYRIPSGTFYINRTAGFLNMFLSAVYGQGNYIDSYYKNQIFLNHKLIEQKHIQLGDLLNRSREMLLMSEGVREVYTSIGLLTSNDVETQRVRNGYCREISGDIIIEIAPGWKLMNEDNQQQQQNQSYCMAFPVIFYGNGFPAERVQRPVTTDQIAPTISKSIRIRAPNACKSAPLH